VKREEKVIFSKDRCAGGLVAEQNTEPSSKRREKWNRSHTTKEPLAKTHPGVTIADAKAGQP